MVLTVVVPDDRPGMQQMLRRELSGLEHESEILVTDWLTGLSIAQGDFICLLEHDSAVSAGSIAKQLEPFLNNPRFRKLAMVSPLVEFEDTSAMEFHDNNGTITFKNTSRNTPQLTRIGSIAGSIIRKSSLIQRLEMLEKKGIVRQSLAVSLDFWNNGLRVICHPEAVYYCPDELFTATIPEYQISEAVAALWNRECIA